MYFYRVYGLNVKSDRQIKELVAINSTENIDVEIVWRKIKKEKLNILKEGTWLYYSNDLAIFRIRSIASYLIENGNKITIDEYENCGKDGVKIFILGTALGFCMKQRNIVAIHGGAISIGDKAVIFTGRSGAGKSTITNSFINRGFKFLADDVSALGVMENGEVTVNSAYPQQKICIDTMRKMGYDIENFKLINECRGKYIIPARDNFEYKSKKLKAIFEINATNDDKVSVIELKGVKKLDLIIKNIYREEITLKNGIEPEFFKKIVDIAKNISVYRISRPKGTFSVSEQVEGVLDKLNYEEEEEKLIWVK